jgi:hypothetical protein
MDANKKTILLSVVGAIVAAIVVQQIAYRNSMEFKIRSGMEQEKSRIVAEDYKFARWCERAGRAMKKQYPDRLAEIYAATRNFETHKLSLSPDEEKLSLCIDEEKFSIRTGINPRFGG